MATIPLQSNTVHPVAVAVRGDLPPWWADVTTPAAYPEKTATVTVKETHISWVFLTDRHAYKLRKPVKFSFVDFSTLERRKRDCDVEVDLNKRLAAEVYLGVVPLVRLAAGGYRFGGSGEVVDYAVKMVRLPEAACLSSVLSHRRLTSAEVASLGHLLLDFYRQLAPATLTTQDYFRRIERHIAENDADLRTRVVPSQQSLLRRLLQAQLFYVRVFQDELSSRVQDGQIVEGHGDLRPEHVYMLGKPVVIDAVEFSTELRQVDVLDELAFLAMECDRLGYTAVGDQLRQLYQAGSKDLASDRLWYFYKLYRAMVRAKVHALRADQLSGAQQQAALAEVKDYLILAEHYAEKVAPPVVFVVGGISGSGKSTLARQLAEELALERFSTDDLRHRLAQTHQEILTPSTKYSLPARDWIYEQLLAQARPPLRQGLSVVLDGTFLRQPWRQAARRLAVDNQAMPWFIHCTCPVPVAQARIADRKNDTSEATGDVLAGQLEALDHEPWSETNVDIDTTECLAAQVRTVYESLRRALPSSRHTSRGHAVGQ